MQFKQDDKAICTFTDGVVKIKSDLFTSAGTGVESYLVEWTGGIDKGKRSVVYATDLEPAPRFKKGQKVLYRDRVVELVSGPFLDSDGDLFWVVKGEKAHDQAWEMCMESV